MRALAVLVLCAGCPSSDSHDGLMCETDSQCGGDICARDGECIAASQVRQVKITWTIDGQPASATTCGPAPSLYLQFDGPTFQDTFGFAPVPCMQGQFTIDRLPKRFDQVELGADGGFNQVTGIDSSNSASFDLHL